MLGKNRRQHIVVLALDDHRASKFLFVRRVRRLNDPKAFITRRPDVSGTGAIGGHSGADLLPGPPDVAWPKRVFCASATDTDDNDVLVRVRNTPAGHNALC